MSRNEYLSLIALMGALIIPMIARYNNMELTETQFVYKFWPLFLADLVLVWLSCFLSHKS